MTRHLRPPRRPPLRLRAMPAFQRYLGIDYSGARTPECGLPGIRAYAASPEIAPAEIAPPRGRRRHWSRRDLANWLVGELREGPRTLVGIDHSFSFPQSYFDAHGLGSDWNAFLEDFRRHWPTHLPGVSVESVRRGEVGDGSARAGSARWRRLAERRSRAKSVFHFDVPGSVAKSTHAGLPWLLHLREQLGERLHFWPFDGWTPHPQRSVVAEIYPSLWSHVHLPADRDPHQHDAYCAAAWMRDRDAADELGCFFQPLLPPEEASVAAVEGWILGLG